ncbi:MAG: hypothetical protein AAGB93_15555 [Planctomycetota bacterium]
MRSLVLLALTLPAAAQQHTVVLEEGDPITGMGPARSFFQLAVGNDGGTFVHTGLFVAGTWRTVVVRDREPFLEADDPLSTGQYVRAGQMVVDARGGFAAAPVVQGPAGPVALPGLVRNRDLLVWPQAPLGFPGAAPGGRYQYVSVVRSLTPNRFLVFAGISNPGTRSAVIEIEADASGAIVREELYLQDEGQLPGTSRTTWVNGPFAGNARGDRIANVFLSRTTGFPVRAVVLNDEVVLEEETPSIVPGLDWFIPPTMEAVDLNEAGDWVARAALDDGSGFWDECIVKNGEIVVRDGDVLPDIAPDAIDRSDLGPELWLTDEGDVVWLGSWGTGAGRRSGVFFNERLLLTRGTMVDGLPFDPDGLPRDFAISPDRGRMLFGGELDTGTGVRHDAVVQTLLDISETFCPAAVNSTGRVATMSVFGSPRAADNDVTLRATNLPRASWTHFFTSPERTVVPAAGGSEGTLCVGGAIGRYAGPGQILRAGAPGRVELPIDLDLHPTAQGSVAVRAGETWHFQAWYRDTRDGAATSNFTDAASVTFE